MATKVPQKDSVEVKLETIRAATVSAASIPALRAEVANLIDEVTALEARIAILEGAE